MSQDKGLRAERHWFVVSKYTHQPVCIGSFRTKKAAKKYFDDWEGERRNWLIVIAHLFVPRQRLHRRPK